MLRTMHQIVYFAYRMSIRSGQPRRFVRALQTGYRIYVVQA